MSSLPAPVGYLGSPPSGSVRHGFTVSDPSIPNLTTAGHEEEIINFVCAIAAYGEHRIETFGPTPAASLTPPRLGSPPTGRPSPNRRPPWLQHPARHLLVRTGRRCELAKERSVEGRATARIHTRSGSQRAHPCLIRAPRSRLDGGECSICLAMEEGKGVRAGVVVE